MNGKAGDILAKAQILPRVKLLSLILIIATITIPFHVSGEVKPITELQDKLEGISEEEKKVLEKLFTISQKMEELEGEINQINQEIEAMQVHIEELETQIDEKQKDYNFQLDTLKQVLVNYQRGGPASYFEILLRVDNFTDFLKSINLIKDISHNVDELLVTVDERKKELEAEKEVRATEVLLLESKKKELAEPLQEQMVLQAEQEEYLASLKEDRADYQEQLNNLVQVWEDCKLVFTDIKDEISTVVKEGYFTLEDLNLNYGFFKIEGVIYEEAFNRVLREHSNMSETIFHFSTDRVVLEIPEKHLVLTGMFELRGENTIEFVVSEGTFYELLLEAASIDELFLAGPLSIDFKELAGENVTIDFTLTEVTLGEGSLNFDIRPQFSFFR
ncbi:MAG: hypothetical protein K0S76_2554 [Herbinix sp.]|jgi:peptidoglycan hydrolase CwlO-like protein|nr:hypothetical protein [Herbinix sp.]